VNVYTNKEDDILVIHLWHAYSVQHTGNAEYSFRVSIST